VNALERHCLAQYQGQLFPNPNSIKNQVFLVLLQPAMGGVGLNVSLMFSLPAECFDIDDSFVPARLRFTSPRQAGTLAILVSKTHR
jgi:hypothetical protein